MIKKFTDHAEREAGLTLVELLVALVVGAMVLSVIVMVSFNVFHVFDTTKSEALGNTDNYSLTTLLHEVAQDATGVSSAGTSAVTLTMGSIPGVLPANFKGATSVTLTWNGSQLQASNMQVKPIVVYNSPNSDAFSFKYDASQKDLFELVPPTPTSQPIYFHVNSNGNIAKSFSPNFSGITMVANPTTVNVGGTVSITGQVTLGNKGVANQTLTLSDNNVGGSFSPTTVTTDAKGNFTVTYTAPTSASNVTITASDAKLGVTGTVSVTVETASMTLSATPNPVAIGQPVTISGQVLINNQGANNQTVTLSDNKAGWTTTVTTDANGHFTATYTTPTSASTVTITAVDAAFNVTQTVQLGVETPTITIAASPTTVDSGGTVSLTGQVTLGGTEIANQAVDLSADKAGGSFSPITVTTDTNGDFTATYTAPTSASTVTITASDAKLGATGTVSITVGSPSMTLSATPNLVATGQPVAISGQVLINNQGANNQTVTLSDNNAGGSFTPITVTTDANGHFTATYTTPTSASTVTITASDVALSVTKTVQIGVETPSITMAASPTSVNSGGTVSLTGQVTLGGTGLANQTVTLSDNKSGGSFTSTTVTTDASGNFTATYTAPTSASRVTITAADATLGATDTVQVTVETASMTLSATPSPVATGQSVTITGQVMLGSQGDANQQTVTLSDNKAGGSFSSTTVTTDANGKFTVTYTAPTSASNVIITASDAALNVTKTVLLSVETPAITISANPTTVNSGGEVTITGQVTLGGKVFANQPVTLSDNNAGGSFTPTTVTTDTNGNFTTTYTAATPSLPNVEWLGNSSNPTIVINDVGFGSTPPTDIPAYNTDGNYVGVTDTTGNWSMGMTGNYVAEDILAWSDNQIVVQPTSQTSDQGGGSKHGYDYGYGNQGWYTQNGWLFKQGDHVQITVQNASGQSIVIPTTVNYQSNNVTGTVTITATSDGATASTNLTVNMGYSLPVTQNTLQISNVSWKFDGNSNPVITITGSGFGTQSNWWLIKKDFDGSLVISDTSGSWEMGNWGDPVMENIQSWSDTQITLRPGWGYGKQWWKWWGGGTNTFNSGDNYTVTLNANGNSTSYTSTVPSHDQKDHGQGNRQDNGQGNGNGNGR